MNTFFKLPNGEHLNVSRIHKLVFDGNRTKIFFSQMAHDSISLDGDRTADILAAARGDQQPKPRR